MSDAAAANFLDSVRDKLPKMAGMLISAAFFVGTLLVNYTSKTQHFVDVQAQQEKRITDLEIVVKHDMATQREMNDVKATVNRIEDKLDEEIQYHHRR